MNKVEIKRNREKTVKEAIEMYNRLKNLTGLTGVKLNYAVNRSMLQLQPVCEAFSPDKVIPTSKGYKSYLTALNEAYKALATTDGKTRTRIAGDNEIFDTDTNSPAAIEIRAELKNKYAKEIDQREKDIQDYSELLNSACPEFKLFKIKPSDIPEDATKEVWDAISDLIDYESDTTN